MLFTFRLLFLWFIVDTAYGRWDTNELMDVLFDKVRQWGLRSVGIEKGMLKDVLEPVIWDKQRRLNIWLDLTPVEHMKAGSKLERIKALQPRFKAHTILFPDYADWLGELESELAGVTKDEIKSLYIDLVDALAMQNQIVQPPYRLSRNYKNLPRYAEEEYDVFSY